MFWFKKKKKKQPLSFKVPNCVYCDSENTFFTQLFPMFDLDNVCDHVCEACGKWAFAHKEQDGTIIVNKAILKEWVIKEENEN